jgi:MoaA/NifB/PqqE/SkfB family radical SAM enzyme
VRRAGASAQPLSALLELTYGCSWRCSFCYNPRHHDVRPLTGGEWAVVLDDLRDLGVLWVALTGGEPLLHPDFFRVAEETRRRAFGLRVFTNGTLVDEATARRLASLEPVTVELSLHGATAAVHDAATRVRGSYERALAAVDRLRGAGVRVVVKTLVTLANEGEVPAIVSLAAGLGVELRLDLQVTPRDGGDATPLRHRASREGTERVLSLLARAGALSDVPRAPGEWNCGIGRSTMTIDPEGNVFPCMQWRHQSLGNVRSIPLRRLWPGSPLREELADLAVAVNATLLSGPDALSRYPFCPALAYAETGSAVAPSPVQSRLAAAAESARTRAIS